VIGVLLLALADAWVPDPETAPLDPIGELHGELQAREEDRVRTMARSGRIAQERYEVRETEARAQAERLAAETILRTTVGALYRMAHVTRLALSAGEAGRETAQALFVLTRRARQAQAKRARAENDVEQAGARRVRLDADAHAAEELLAALDARIAELRAQLGLPEREVPPEPTEVAIVELPAEPAPAAATAAAPTPPSTLEGADFVHPVWSALPLLWAKRGCEAPILRYPTYDGAILRAAYSGRVAAVEHARGKGRVVRIEHGAGISSVLTDFLRVTVREGDVVARGAVLGRARGPVFFEMLEEGRNVDPRPWLDIPMTRDP